MLPSRASWKLTGVSRTPLEYYQGVTSDPKGNLYFDGIFSGLYRTDARLRETARNERAIPPDVRRREGYNHIGDISWDRAEGGRLLLPLACHRLNERDKLHTCKTGSIGVADPKTLKWRYHVKLDPAEITGANWVEVSPDGELAWTAARGDLLAYRTADITAANAAPRGPVLKAARRLVGAAPVAITGATFHGGLLFVAGPPSGPLEVWSIDVTDGSSNFEIKHDLVGEPEGLDDANALGGVLHALIGTHTKGNARPTYGRGHTALLHFVRVGVCANLVTGTGASETLRGIASGDKLHGLAGNDVLRGGRGSDCLFGGAGRDELAGGTGSDRLVGDAGEDRLDAGAGDDEIDAADGANDEVACGPGSDSVRADREDVLSGCEKRLS